MAVSGIPLEDQIPRERIIRSLKANGGLLLHTAKDLGLERRTLQHYFNSSDELKEELRQARQDYVESRMDVGEAVLDKLMSRVDTDPNHAFKSSIYVLNNHGRERGYAHPDAQTASEEQEGMLKRHMKGAKQLQEAAEKARQDSERSMDSKSISEEQ